MCVHGTHGDRKSVLYALELEYWIAVSHQAGAGNQIQILCNGNKYS